MSELNRHGSSDHVFRVDRIIVPRAARPDFLVQSQTVSDFLRKQDGFVHSIVLEQQSSSDEICFYSIVEWESDLYRDAAGVLLAEMQRERGFDREAFRAKHGIAGDFGTYRTPSGD